MWGNKAPFGPSDHFPQRGKIFFLNSSPSGGSTGEAGEGGYPPRFMVSRAMITCWIWLVPS